MTARPEYEHTVIGVFDPDSQDPPFCYTSGLWPGRPEMLVVGLDPRDGAWLLNWLSERPRSPGVIRLDGAAQPIMLRAVNPAEAHEKYVKLAVADCPVDQVIVPDPQGWWPWDPDCAEPYASLPVLTVFGDGS